MSTTEQTRPRIPTGTWTLDPVHSSIGFAVKHSGVDDASAATFDEFDATLADGRLEGTAQGRQRPGRRPEPRRPPADARLLRRRAVSRAALRLDRRFERDGDRVSIDGDLTIQRRHAARRARRARSPARSPTATATSGSGSTSRRP